jgi:Family of unknown function (DUF6416)
MPILRGKLRIYRSNLRNTMMIDVTVKVPEELVGELYAAVGRLLAGHPDPGTVVQAGETAEIPLRSWRNTDEDLFLAREVWGKLSSSAVGLFSHLMDSSGQRVSGEDLAAELEIPNGKYGIAGVLAWPGRYCATVHRQPLWSWEYGPAGGSADYWLEPDVADLFKRVR